MEKDKIIEKMYGDVKYIAEYIDIDTAIKIWGAFPGCHLDIPSASLKAWNKSMDLRWIAERTDVDTAIKMWKAFPGTKLEINRGDVLRREIRDTKIRADYDSGISVRVIALKNGLTERTVWTILKQPDPQEAMPQQLALSFG